MLENHGRRTFGEVLQNVGPVVHVGEVGLARMLSGLDHLGFGKGGNNAVARPAPSQAAAGQGTPLQGIERGGLIGIFAVAQAFFFLVQGPDAFFIDEFLLAQDDGHGFGKSVLADSAVHGLEIRHAASDVVAGRGSACIAQKASRGQSRLSGRGGRVDEPGATTYITTR